jgi:hypothetical protein
MNIEQAIAIFERVMRLRDPALLTPECCEIALSALREKQERENPKPLTLEELKERDGKPVWTVTKGVDGSGRWELVTFTTICACPWHQVITMVNLLDGETEYEISTYGKTWLAYSHEPKESHK